MKIEVVADVVYPWCNIGKRRLEQALVGAAPEALAAAIREAATP